MGMDVKIADLVGGKDPADLVLNNPEDWKIALRNAKPIIEFELGNVMRDTPDHRKISRALRERIFPFLARIESSMDKDHFVQMIADKADIGKDAIWQDLRSVEEKIRTEQKAAATTSSQNSQPVNASSLPRVSRIDLVERRLFGLLGLMRKNGMPIVETYEKKVKEILGESYAEYQNKIEPILSDCIFEAEALFGKETDKLDYHMKELLTNFEIDLVTEQIIDTMQQLKVAEKAGDSALVVELAKKCQELSVKKSEVAKKK